MFSLLLDGHLSFQAMGRAGTPGMLEAAPVVGKLLELDGIKPPGFCMSPSLSRGCCNYFVLEADRKCRLFFFNFYFFSDSHIFYGNCRKKKADNAQRGEAGNEPAQRWSSWKWTFKVKIRRKRNNWSSFCVVWCLRTNQKATELVQGSPN